VEHPRDLAHPIGPKDVRKEKNKPQVDQLILPSGKRLTVCFSVGLGRRGIATWQPREQSVIA
jgi:hypothetical protein